MSKSQFNAANLHMQYVSKDLFVEDHVLQSACDSAGLDTRWRRDPVKTSRAFTRAVKAVELPENHEVRQVKSKDKEVSSKEITFEVLEVSAATGGNENIYTNKCTIKFDRLTNQIYVLHCYTYSSEGRAIERRCRELYKRFTSHNATDIRELALKFLRTQGLMSMPGLYYVAPTESNTRDLVALKDVFSQLSDIYPDHEVAFPDLTDVVWARKSLEADIDSITKALESIDPEKARESTLGNKMEEFNTLRGKIELYASALQFKADDLQDRITDVASKFRKRMLGELELPEAHKPATPAPVIPITSARAEEQTAPSVDDIMSMIGEADDEVGF
ncbi:MAG: hypothetical protein CME17_05075 [Gemmatimonadetes bacterium]|nr:hypothetical protein [Gemmatimonadota bacterium]